MDHFTNIAESAQSENREKLLLIFRPLMISLSNRAVNPEWKKTRSRPREATQAAGVQYVEFQDVYQECCAKVIELAASCTDYRWLTVRIHSRLPQHLARFMRRTAPQSMVSEAGWDAMAETMAESETWRRLSEEEIEDILRGALTDEERDIVQALRLGFTQREIAECLKVTQQAVSKRIAGIRQKLRSFNWGVDQVARILDRGDILL